MTSHALRSNPQVGEIPRLIDWVERCCARGRHRQRSVTFRLALALDEAVTNVIGHAFAGQAAAAPYHGRLDITATSGGRRDHR